jgi:cysteinyl-tRNA synthetase
MRLVFLGTHYRKPLDWTDARVREMKGALNNWYMALQSSYLNFDGKDNWDLYMRYEDQHVPTSVINALSDDLNTPLVISEMHRLANDGGMEATRELLASMQLLGLFNRNYLESTGGISWTGSIQPEIEKAINILLFARSDARKAKDYRRADAIRDALAAAGVEVRDTGQGPEWNLTPDFDATKLPEPSDV